MKISSVEVVWVRGLWRSSSTEEFPTEMAKICHSTEIEIIISDAFHFRFLEKKHGGNIIELYEPISFFLFIIFYLSFYFFIFFYGAKIGHHTCTMDLRSTYKCAWRTESESGFHCLPKSQYMTTGQQQFCSTEYIRKTCIG